MEPKNSRLKPEDCIAFALECEGDAQMESDPEHRERLLRMARVVRELAADLDKRPTRHN